jgi:predicted metalloprotease
VGTPTRPAGGRSALTRLLLVLFGCLVLAGCGTDAAESEPDPEPGSVLPAVENVTGPPRYRELVDESFSRLGEFWKAQLAKDGVEIGYPKRLISYRGRSGDARCEGVKALPQNAFYCPANTTISWDANWVHGDLWRYAGAAAVAYLLAHEYGHFVQDKMGIQNKFAFTIEGELHADCLAGAWLGKMDRDVARLKRADIKGLYLGVLDVADPRGTPWVNPSAHGRAVERRQAIGTGFRRGLSGCMKVYPPGFSK